VRNFTANQRGILAIVACMASYTINDVLVKDILSRYPVGETIFLRGVMCCLLLGGFALVFGHGAQFRAISSKRLMTRSAFDGLSTAGFIAALAHMQLGNLSAVLQVAPLIITALSVLFYGETVRWRRWTAIGVGFAGALFVIKPVPSAFDIWAVVGVASALAAALREMTNRRIDQRVPTLVIAFWGAAGITLCGVLFYPVEQWRAFAPNDLMLLFVAAIFVALAIYLLALGFRGVDLSVVAPFRYSYILTSTLGGFLVFGEWPDGWSTIGAVLIVASGIYAVHREAVRRREIASATAPAA
jgi:drug/metabolite transporter (DMT)-like permease